MIMLHNNIKVLGFSFIFGLLAMTAIGQGRYVLRTDFSGCAVSDVSGFNVQFDTLGTPDCVCTPSGDGYQFNGIDDAFTVQDTNVRFPAAFSVSFVFRPDSDLDNQRMVSYKEACNSPMGFDITYHGSSNQLTFNLSEMLGRSIAFDIDLEDRCWHAVTFVKTGSIYITYLYGEEVFQTRASGSFDVGRNGTLTIGNGPCVPTFVNAFDGVFDYFSVYDETLPISEIRSTVYETNRIVEDNALIFLGESFTPTVDAPCATGFNWMPTNGVSDINVAEPILDPIETTVYDLVITDGGCRVTDSLRLLVVDPTAVTCEELILPTAFTPNGDNLNDTYFISNGFVLDDLIMFEIFDRWGGKLFSTTDVTMGWDGTHQGEVVMPGVYVYKAEFECNNETRTQVGSFSVLN